MPTGSLSRSCLDRLFISFIKLHVGILHNEQCFVFGHVCADDDDNPALVELYQTSLLLRITLVK